MSKFKGEAPKFKNKFVFNKPTEIKQMINKTNINVFNPYSEQRKYNYVLLEDNYEDNIELNYLTDYFTLEERIKANFINNSTFTSGSNFGLFVVSIFFTY